MGIHRREGSRRRGARRHRHSHTSTSSSSTTSPSRSPNRGSMAQNDSSRDGRAQEESSSGRGALHLPTNFVSKAREADDRGTIASSVRSSHSNDSLDTAALSNAQEDDQEAARLVDERGPPPAYEPRNTTTAEHVAHRSNETIQVPARSEPSYGTIAATEPSAQLNTHAEIEEGPNTPEAAPLLRSRKKKKHRPNCWCGKRKCSLCKCSKKRFWLLVGVIAVLVFISLGCRGLFVLSSRKVSIR